MNDILSSGFVSFDGAAMAGRIADFNLMWLDQMREWASTESRLLRSAGIEDYPVDCWQLAPVARKAIAGSGRPLVSLALQRRIDLERALRTDDERMLHPRIIRLNAAFLRLIIDVVRWDLPTGSAGFGIFDSELSAGLATLSDEQFAALVQSPLLMRPRFSGPSEFQTFLSALTSRGDGAIIKLEALFVAGVVQQRQNALSLDDM